MGLWTSPDRAALARTAPLFTERYGRGVHGNRAAYCHARSSPIVEICGAVRTQLGFHRASYAVMPYWPFVGPRIFYEMMTFEIRYHEIDARP
jgi:hypothetical protein